MKTLFSLLAVCLLFLSAKAELNIIWTSKALVSGETVEMYLIQEDGSHFTLESLPAIKNGTIKLEQSGYLPWSQSPTGRAYLYLFTCIPDREGIMEVPSFQVKTENGLTLTTDPQFIDILPYENIEWLTYTKNITEEPYGILYHLNVKTPYVNQPVRAEIKIYAPAELNNFNFPDMKSDSLAISRFRPSFLRQSVLRSGEALLKGKNWNVYSYSGSVSPLKPGSVTLGPGTVDANLLTEHVDSRWGQVIRQLVTVPLMLPKHGFEARPLPPGAPPGYVNAVGRFSLSTSTNASDITEGEPISVNVKIQGVGNLNILTCPVPDDEENWKIYPPNKLTPTDSTSDTIEFQLLMRPLKPVSEIPGFNLVYFDPEKKSYETASSAPIPLKWKGSSSVHGSISSPPPPAGTVPVEEMSDIIHTEKTPASIVVALSATFSHTVLWPWFILPAFIIVLLGIFLRIREYKLSNSQKRLKCKKLSEIGPGSDSITFLRNLGSFIESEIPPQSRNETLNAILAERDEKSFLPNGVEVNLSKGRKLEMLKAVSKVIKLLPCLLLLLALSPGYSQESAAKAFMDGNYPEARELIVKETTLPLDKLDRADQYYLTGNIEYKMGEPGLAALNYRRCLQIAPDHFEARRNLAFIERKEGSLTDRASTTQKIIGKIPYIVCRLALLFGLLGITLIAATMWSFRKKGVSWWFGIALTILLLVSGLFCLINYPRESNPLFNRNLFVITSKDAAAWHAATKNSSHVFPRLPQGSTAHILHDSGHWMYVEFPTGARGWITKESGSKVIP